MENSNYKDSIKTQFETMVVQAGDLPYGTSALKMVVEETIDLTKSPDDRWDHWLKCLDAKARKELLDKSHDFTMAFIYVFGCNSNEMRTNMSKSYGLGDDWYYRTLK